MSVSAKNHLPATDKNAHRLMPVSYKLVAGIGLAILLLIALGWFAAAKREDYRKISFVIPAGTSRQLESGNLNVAFPDEVILTLGLQDTIIIENQDDVIHSFGPFVIGPQSILTKRFDVPITYEGACTFHQEQQMRLVVNPAPWDIFN
jgi:hypothetical protein